QLVDGRIKVTRGEPVCPRPVLRSGPARHTRGPPVRRDGAGYQARMSRSETTITVLVAGTANLVLAITKIFAGVLSGSSAMLAEGAHSVADTLNQVFLLTSLRRSARPPDRLHPFGYGNDRYFWSLLAAFGIF